MRSEDNNVKRLVAPCHRISNGYFGQAEVAEASFTSMMAIEASICGNRVIGATEALVEARLNNPRILQVAANGIIITTEHIIVALRDLAEVSSDLGSQFGIQVPLLNLFG